MESASGEALRGLPFMFPHSHTIALRSGCSGPSGIYAVLSFRSGIFRPVLLTAPRRGGTGCVLFASRAGGNARSGLMPVRSVPPENGSQRMATRFLPLRLDHAACQLLPRLPQVSQFRDERCRTGSLTQRKCRKGRSTCRDFVCSVKCFLNQRFLKKHGRWNIENEILKVLPSPCRLPHSGRFALSYAPFESLSEQLFLPFSSIELCRGRKYPKKNLHGRLISAFSPVSFCSGRNNVIYPLKSAFLTPFIFRFSAESAFCRMYGRPTTGRDARFRRPAGRRLHGLPLPNGARFKERVLRASRRL